MTSDEHRVRLQGEIVLDQERIGHTSERVVDRHQPQGRHIHVIRNRSARTRREYDIHGLPEPGVPMGFQLKESLQFPLKRFQSLALAFLAHPKIRTNVTANTNSKQVSMTAHFLPHI